MINRRNLFGTGAGLAFAALMPRMVLAQGNKTMTITVGFAPGGPGEVLARRIAEAMREKLGQTIIVNNKPGASGMLAAATLKNAPADGTQLVFAPPGIVTTQPIVNKKLPYDPAELQPVAGINEFAFAFAVPAKHPAKNLKEFAEWARKQSQGTMYGVLGLGNMPHFIGYRFAREGGFKMDPVAYKGAKEIVNDMLGGNLPSGINVTAGFAQEHKAGTLRVLGVTGRKRSALFPDVPTFTEEGFPTVTAVESFGLYAPKGLPKQEADRIYQAVLHALNQPEVKQFMAINDFVPVPLPADKYGTTLQESIGQWGPVIRASGFQIE